MTQLSQQRIVDAALDILQHYGLQDLSIRKVAVLLNVQPGALYWHFPHKQALLGAVANYILSIPPTESTHSLLPSTNQPEWISACSVLLDDLHVKLLSVRDGAELVSAAFAAQTCTIPHLESIEELLSNNIPQHATYRSIFARSLVVFTLGATVDEQTRLQMSELVTPDEHSSPHIHSSSIFRTGAQLLLTGLLNLVD